MKLVRFLIICCLAQLMAGHALAQDEGQPHAARGTAADTYMVGNYAAASDLAHQEKDYDLATRAALVHGGYRARGAEAEKWFARAEVLSNEAMASSENPGLRIRMTAALVLSYKAKQKRSVKMVNRAKRMIEDLIREYPDEAIAHGALAGWHSEISAAGFIPRLILGASRKKAGLSFEKARSLDDNKIPLNLEYAKFLARGGKSEQIKAQAILKKILAAEPHGDFEKLLKGKAQKILKAVKSGNKRDIKRIIAENSAFPDF